MHRAIASTTVQAATSASKRQIIQQLSSSSSSIWKRQVTTPTARPSVRSISRSRRRGYGQTIRQDQSSLAVESVTQLCKSTTTRTLSRDQIRSIFFTAAVPMVGFGFMDNFIMIQAGSYIDSTLGVQLGLATMTAAAMGQVVSDVSGVLFGGTLERVARPFMGPPARLDAAQKQLAMVPRLKMAGAVVGVIVGCCLGATALLFVKQEDGKTQNSLRHQLEGVLLDMANDWDPKADCNIYWRHASKEFDASTPTMAVECAQERQPLVDGTTVYLPIPSQDRTHLAVVELRRETIPSLEDMQEAKHMARHVGIFWKRLQEE